MLQSSPVSPESDAKVGTYIFVVVVKEEEFLLSKMTWKTIATPWWTCSIAFYELLFIYLQIFFFPTIEHSYKLLNQRSFHSFYLYFAVGGRSKKRGIFSWIISNWGQVFQEGESTCVKWRIQLESPFTCSSPWCHQGSWLALWLDPRCESVGEAQLFWSHLK